MRANYDPQKVWLQFIKVELYPSEKRGVPNLAKRVGAQAHPAT